MLRRPERTFWKSLTRRGSQGDAVGRNPDVVASRVRKRRPFASKTGFGACGRQLWIDRRLLGIEGRQTSDVSYPGRQSRVVAQRWPWSMRLQIVDAASTGLWVMRRLEGLPTVHFRLRK